MRRRLFFTLAAVLAAGAGLSHAQQGQQPVAQPAAPASPAARPAPAPALRPPVDAPVQVVDIPPIAAPVAPPPPAKPAKPEPPPKPAEPLKRARSNVAILQALDKVTAETMRFEAPVGQPIRYKTLVFTVRACETSAADEPAPEAAVYLQVVSQQRLADGKLGGATRPVFKGWMFASTPGANAMQHPVYDAWLVACKTTSAPPPTAPSR